MPAAATADDGSGERHLMVAMELLMSLYALLYAFPHVPSSVLEEEGGAQTQWLSVTSVGGLRGALQTMLQSSEILIATLPPGMTADDITVDVASSAPALSRLFDLRLYDRTAAVPVPATCRQMFETIAAVYRNIASVSLTSREELHGMMRRCMVLPSAHRLPNLDSAIEEERALLRFCANLAVAWLQPYFARDSNFYLPPGSDVCHTLLRHVVAA